LVHESVLLKETIEALNLRPGAIVVDGTLGSGGHTKEILKYIGPQGRLIALDQDLYAIKRCQAKWGDLAQIQLEHANFRALGQVLANLNVLSIDAVILDVGISSDQLQDGSRGFSFQEKGPLDMRMNTELAETAEELIARLSEKELADVLFQFGEERRSRRIAKAMKEKSRSGKLKTTEDLAQVVCDAVLGPRRTSKSKPSSKRFRIHPATKTFQALRIAVNDELGALKEGLSQGWNHLGSGGRLGVISFHSLEDRIVKRQMREWKDNGEGTLIFKKPVIPTREEIIRNPRARSAKLRCVEKN